MQQQGWRKATGKGPEKRIYMGRRKKRFRTASINMYIINARAHSTVIKHPRLCSINIFARCFYCIQSVFVFFSFFRIFANMFSIRCHFILRAILLFCQSASPCQQSYTHTLLREYFSLSRLYTQKWNNKINKFYNESRQANN